MTNLEMHDFGRERKIAVLSVGGSASTYIDPQTQAVFRMEKKEDITSFFDEEDITCSWTLFSGITENQYFLKMSDWRALYEFIKKRYRSYDGFVILQETDSLAFSASLFSYLFSGCRKPIIFTASPVPLGDLQYGNCAYNNIKDSLRFACSDLGEVCIYSHGQLVRSTRSERRNITEGAPFYSSQTDLLGEKNDGYNLYLHRKHRDGSLFQCDYDFPDKKVFFMRLIPSDTLEVLSSLRFSPEAIMIQTLGYGSLPPNMVSLLENFGKMGVRIVLIAEHDSQNRSFSLDNDLQNVPGAILLKNMTVWASLAKTYLGVENTTSFLEFKEFMTTPLAGDIVEE